MHQLSGFNNFLQRSQKIVSWTDSFSKVQSALTANTKQFNITQDKENMLHPISCHPPHWGLVNSISIIRYTEIYIYTYPKGRDTWITLMNKLKCVKHCPTIQATYNRKKFGLEYNLEQNSSPTSQRPEKPLVLQSLRCYRGFLPSVKVWGGHKEEHRIKFKSPKLSQGQNYPWRNSAKTDDPLCCCLL